VLPYVVRTGDHLELIAHRVGSDVNTIWNDPKNAELKKKRAQPNMLCRGDILYVPARKIEWLPVETSPSACRSRTRPAPERRLI
jgi:hypothetical protein